MIPHSNNQGKFQNEFKYQKKSKKGYIKVTGEEKTVLLPKEEKKNEISSQSISSGEKTESNFKNLIDFPELKVYTGHENNSTEDRRNKKHFNKSWISVVNSADKKKNFNESFPKLPSSNDFTKTKISLIGPAKGSIEENKQEEANKEPNTRKPEDSTRIETKDTKNKNISSSSKKSGKQPQKNPTKKKKNDPIFLNFSDVLNEEKTKIRRRQPKFSTNKVKKTKEKEKIYGNILDSAKPKLHRGKHREIKKKKFTRLKFAIIKERIFKQKVRERAVAEYFGKECSDLYTQINYKVEIKNYLENFNKRKIQFKKTNKIKNIGGIKKEEKAEVKQNTLVSESTTKKEVLKNTPKETNHTVENTIRFSSKFREYCDNLVTPSLDLAVNKFVVSLVNLQDKFFARDPIKATARKRHVSGLKEVKKYLILNKVKVMVLAPDLEKLQMEGSVFDLIEELKCTAKEQNVPYAFALGRFKLGRCTRKNVPVSAFACLNYDGVEVLYENVIAELNEARSKFGELSRLEKPSDVKEEKESDVTSEIISSFIKAFRDGLQVTKTEETDSEKSFCDF